MGNSMEPVHIEHTADTTHVALEAALGIADARVLHEKLNAALAAKRLECTVEDGQMLGLQPAIVSTAARQISRLMVASIPRRRESVLNGSRDLDDVTRSARARRDAVLHNLGPGR